MARTRKSTSRRSRARMLKPFQIPVPSKFGAPMGRPEASLDDFQIPVYLQKVPMIDGDYDEGGAYWGGSKLPLYCAWDDEGHAAYVRAEDSSAAKQKLPSHWTYAEKQPGAKNSLYAEEMLQQYMETALWSSTDMDDEAGDTPLDKNYTTDDIAVETKKKMLADCQKFYDNNQAILENPEFGWPADQAGHEFWLDRNGHGSGFLDSEYGTSDAREALSKASQRFGEINLYDSKGKLYC